MVTLHLARRSLYRAAGLLFGIIVLGMGAYGRTAADSQKKSEPVLVSMIQLIATPEKFDGRLVRLLGFAHFEWEGDALYLHREDFEANLTTNAVRLVIDGPLEKYKKLSDMHVLVDGRFSVRGPSPFGRYAGTISDIVLLERLPTRAELTPKTSENTPRR